MVDTESLVEFIYSHSSYYQWKEAFATAWNFRFADNLFQFGKDFH